MFDCKLFHGWNNAYLSMYVIKEKQPSFFQSNCLGDFNDLKNSKLKNLHAYIMMMIMTAESLLKPCTEDDSYNTVESGNFFRNM